MAHWCMTSVAVNGPKTELDVLERELEKALSSNPVATHFGKAWLGNILLHLGWTEDDIRNSDMRCRGTLSCMQRGDDEQLSFEVKSAYVPHLGPVMEIARKYAPNCEIIYTADEMGYEIHITNDPCVVGTYFVDCNLFSHEEWKAFEGWDDPVTKQEILRRISAFLGREYKSNIKAAVKALNKKLKKPSNFRVIPYSYCAVDECI